MATRTTTKTAAPSPDAVDEYDFDNWDQDAEDAALAALNDVKHIIVEHDFVGRFADGTIVRIPMRLNLALVDQLQAEHTSEIDQFKSLVQTFGGDDLAAALDKQGLIAVAIITEKYFRCLGRAQELAFPESKPSSS